jgi:hypothetical protein
LGKKGGKRKVRISEKPVDCAIQVEGEGKRGLLN